MQYVESILLLSDNMKLKYIIVYNHRLYKHAYHIIQPVKMLSEGITYMYNAWVT